MKNKVIWITGASSGIGEALAYQFSHMDARLILSARNRDELYRVKSGCKNRMNTHVLLLDLEQTDTLDEKAAEAIRIFGNIDLLINCAGISQRSLALETLPSVEHKLMNVNFWGTVALSKAVLPSMIASGGGHIVCVSSLVGKFGTRFRSGYAAAKHALHGYFDSLRLEVYDQNIFITLACPGFIRTKVSINALTADGTAQNSMDSAQEQGMTAEACASEILKAIQQRKEEVYIGGKETKAIWYKRLFPARFAKYMKTAKVT